MTETILRPRLHSLTGIRAIAAFLVFWHHANENFEGGISSGMVGVSLFYLLSGFVMAWADRDDDTAKAFYGRRFARIYPAYAVAVTAAIFFAVAASRFEVADLSAYTLLQSWVPSENFYFAANAVFWSLSCEAFFYAVYPLIRKITRRVDERGLWQIVIGAAAVSVTIGIVGSFFEQSERLSWAVVAFPLARLPEFVIGVGLGCLMVRGWRPRIPLWIAFLASASAIVVALFTPYALSRYAVTLVPFMMLIVALAAADLSRIRVFTQHSVMMKLGAWSYCFYLIHLMVLQRCLGIAERFDLPVIVAVVLAVPASVLGAWLLHRIVELPAEGALRRKFRPRVDVT